MAPTKQNKRYTFSANKALHWMTNVLIALVFVASAGASENHCHDPATWPEWEEMIAENPFDQGLLGLYGLRIGMCILVERGTIPVETGTVIFERHRESLLNERRKQQDREEGLRI